MEWFFSKKSKGEVGCAPAGGMYFVSPIVHIHFKTQKFKYGMEVKKEAF